MIMRKRSGRSFRRLVVWCILGVLGILQLIVLPRLVLGPPAITASLNTIPLTYHYDPIYSTVHCIGETFSTGSDDSSWKYRSCEYKNICIDLVDKDYVLFVSPQDPKLHQTLSKSSYSSTSLLHQNLTVSLSSVNPRWTGEAAHKHLNPNAVAWHPKIIAKPPEAYYMLPESTVLVPFVSMGGHNKGHMLWDDFFPIYTLLTSFGLLSGEDKFSPLLLRTVLQTPLYGTCDIQKKKTKKCHDNYRQLLPLLGIDPATMSTLQDMRFASTTTSDTSIRYVCAAHGAAGIGMLNDHGAHDHGWDMGDRGATIPHTIGRGPLFFQFRQFMVQNLLGSSTSIAKAQKPKVVLSIHSSTDLGRDLDFVNAISNLKKNFGAIADIQAVEFAQMSLVEQVVLARSSSIFVTVCGGGAFTATFLPRGASLILYYDDRGGAKFTNNRLVPTNTPARLDWDLWHNAATHLRVHWLTLQELNTPQGLQSLMQLVKYELDRLS